MLNKVMIKMNKHKNNIPKHTVVTQHNMSSKKLKMLYTINQIYLFIYS